MGGNLHNLLKKAELASALCAPGVVAEALELLAARGSAAELSASLRVDPVLSLRVRRMSARHPLDAPVLQDLLRAMLLLAPVPDAIHLPRYAENWLMSLTVAHLAQRLASQSGVADGDAAWAAGLGHNLALYLRSDAADSAEFAESSAACVEDLDADGWIADAVRYHAEPLARGKMAHPLVRTVQLAYALAVRQNAVDSVDVRAALAALQLGAADATHLLLESQSEARRLAQHYGLSVPVTLQPAGGGLDRLARVYAGQAAQAALQHYFRRAAQPAEAFALLGDALRVLFGCTRVCLFVADADGFLRLSPLIDEIGGLAELRVSRDDGHSTLSRALVEQAALPYRRGETSAPLVDEQIARRLGVSSFVCQPLALEHGEVGLLVAGEVPPELAGGTAWAMLREAWADALQLPPVAATAAVAPAVPPAAAGDIPRERVRRAIHEVANPLTIMRNYVNLLSSRLGSDSTVQRDLGIISDEIERVARIVRGITATEESQPAPVALEMGSVNSVVSELVRMTLGTLLIPNKVSVQIDLNPEVLPMPLHKDLLKQVLFNLAKNAVEAMPGGGHLKFTTRLIERDGAKQVEIEVADTGPGLPEHVRAHLFEPVVSQKGGDHAGLGLSISRNLIKQMGGDLDCISTPQGSRFLVRLPTLPSAQAMPAAARQGSS